MSEKVLNTRIQLKYDSYANWESVWESFIPKAGEVIFFAVPQSTGEVQQEPAILFKVGNGETTLKNLPWGSAIAADVYAWAKKQSLEWGDLSNDFTTELQTFVEAHSVSDVYRIKQYSESVFKLQKKDAKSEDIESNWIDVAEPIDLTAALTKKVDKESPGTNGTAYIFNESDGGGARFVHNDGSEAFVGVNDGGKDGMMAQIYADELVEGKWVGSRINVYHDKIYYTNKEAVENGVARNNADYEIATKGDIQSISHPEYTIVKQDSAEGNYLATYNLTKDGTSVGASINIPKDFLVKSAEIKTVSEADVPYEGAKVGDKYIDFVINTKDTEEGTASDEHLYLPVKDLVDPYTAGNGIEIDGSNVVSTKAVKVRVKEGEDLQQANVPVYFDITPGADGVTVNSYSIALGGPDDQTAVKYSMDVPCATTETAGLMSAEDKEKLEAAVAGGVTSIKEGNGISVSTTAEGASVTNPEVSVKLDDTTSKIGTEEAHSGLKATEDGLKIDESLTWVFNCGNASEFMNTPSQA